MGSTDETFTIMSIVQFRMPTQKKKVKASVVGTRIDDVLLERFRQCREHGGYLNDGDALRDAVRFWVIAKEQELEQRKTPKVGSA